MAINAVTGIFGSSYIQPVDLEYEEIKKQLIAMGLQPSGSKNTDKAKLREAIMEKELEASQKANGSTSTTASTQTTQPEETDKITQKYKDVLIELGITQTDDVKFDYDQAVKKIEYRLRTTTDEYERRHLLQLKSDIDYEVNAMGYSIQTLSSSAMTGATAMGDMNKQMLVSSGSFNSSGK